LTGLFDTHFKDRSGSPIVAGLDQALKVRNKCRVAIGYGRSTAAFTAHGRVDALRLDRPWPSG
jgi:hypothetical protein